MELGWGLKGRVYERRVRLDFHRYATRSIRQRDIECIEQLLLRITHSSSLLLCWLVVSKHTAIQIWKCHRSKIFESYGVLLRCRNVFLRLVRRLRLRVGSRRIAVGLKPLGYTSNDW